MKKLRTIKPIPGIPVGSILYYDGTSGVVEKKRNYWKIEDLEGFVEEAKEPDEFWFVYVDGRVLYSKDHEFSNEVSNEFRFRTKESAEKFAKALKKTKERDSYLSTTSIFEMDKAYIQDILDALNDRVK